MSDMRYRTIVVDPPWEYNEGRVATARTGRSHNRNRDGDKAKLGGTLRPQMPYLTMTLAAIRGIEVASLAEPDARLFLWTTNRYLPDSFGVLNAWGFTYRQTIVWHKADGGPFVASIAPNTAEFLLVSTVGKPARTGSLPSTVIKDGAPKQHSAKPECFLDYIEQVSPGPYLELFARRQRLGWDTWGNEAFEHVEMA